VVLSLLLLSSPGARDMEDAMKIRIKINGSTDATVPSRIAPDADADAEHHIPPRNPET
jgi:hypothetical protein